jgi:hypothetical protein
VQRIHIAVISHGRSSGKKLGFAVISSTPAIHTETAFLPDGFSGYKRPLKPTIFLCRPARNISMAQERVGESSART